MGIIRHKSVKIFKKFPLLIATGLIVASTISCSQLGGSPTETAIVRPTKTTSVTKSPTPTSTSTITPTNTPSPTPTPAKMLYNNQSIGLTLMYPSDWTIDEGNDLVSFTHPERLAGITVGWYTMIEGQSIAKVAERLAVIVVEDRDLYEPLVVFTEHENSIDVVIRGDNPAGVEWVYRFVVADSGEKALVVETANIASLDEAMKAIFEEMVLSLETIP